MAQAMKEGKFDWDAKWGDQPQPLSFTVSLGDCLNLNSTVYCLEEIMREVERINECHIILDDAGGKDDISVGNGCEQALRGRAALSASSSMTDQERAGGRSAAAARRQPKRA